MKKNVLFNSVLSAAFVCMLVPGNIQAQDEIVVDPGFQTLQTAITENPGGTFLLKRGGTYVVDVELELTEPTIIMGETEPADQPPALIQFFANPGEAEDKQLMIFSASCTVKDVGFIGITTDGQEIRTIFGSNARDLEIMLDGLVIQGARQVFVHDGQNNNKFTIQNSIMFNLAHDAWDNYGGYGFYWGGDSVVYESVNNTWIVSGRIFGNAGAVNTSIQKMDHNSYVATWGDTFFPADDNLMITNNIFYNSQTRGYVGVRTHPDPSIDTVIWEGDFSDWSYDTLAGDIAINPTTYDTAGTRSVVVTNNMKMYSDLVLDFYADNNITEEPFLAGRVEEFGEDLGWTIENNYLQSEGNAVDPQFVMPPPAEAYANMFKNRLNRHLPVDLREEGFPFLNVWFPNDEERTDFIWPLPFDLKPTNTEIYDLGTDGYPLGDLNWFGEDVVAAWEAGEPNPLFVGIEQSPAKAFNLNAYPNPFSDLVEISYTLPSKSKVQIKIYSMVGAEVASLVNQVQVEGNHSLQWNGADLPAGIYFCEIKAGNLSNYKKMIMVK